jgi:restriction system protein
MLIAKTLMSDSTVCNDCGELLDETQTIPEEQRKPCPNCGSTARKYFVSATAHVNLESLVKVEAVGRAVFEATNLLLQTVVVPGIRTSEGQLIEAVAVPWFEIIELLKNDPTVAYQISPRKWEEIIAGTYKKADFDEVILTDPSGDRGRDVIAVKKGVGSVRVIDQVKAYKPDHLVSYDDIRALIGVLHGDGASKGFLTTTSDFPHNLRDDPLITQFIPSRLELINGKRLLERLLELAKKKRR